MLPRPIARASLALLALGITTTGRLAAEPNEPRAALGAAPPVASTVDSAAPPPNLTLPIVHALGLMTAMRASEAWLWPRPFARIGSTALAFHYGQAFSRAPVWNGSRPLFQEDGDRWQINVFGHGMFGSELYLRARSCHLRVWQALLFTGLASATWEYAIEGSGTRPSALDLTFTPAAGLLLGEARYQAWRATRRLAAGVVRSTLATLVDPLGELERGMGAPC